LIRTHARQLASTLRRGMLNVTADDAANLNAAPCYTYGTSEGVTVNREPCAVCPKP